MTIDRTTRIRGRGFGRLVQLLRETVTEWLADRVPEQGAALAFYTIFSLAPLLVLVVAIAGLVFGRQAAEGRIVEQIQRTGLLQLTIDSPVRFLAAFHILYYPGWAGYVDGRSKILMPEDSKGYILMDLPAGIHTLALKYEGTSIQHIGDAVTVIACVALLVLAVLWRRRKQAIPGSAVFFPEPRWSIVVLVLLALSIKAIWIDSQTTLFRKNSSCAAIEDAQIQTDVWFGDRLRLCGLALGQTQVRAGDPMSVTLYWQLDQPVTKPANAFVHLLGSTVNPESGNPLWGQQDKDTPGEHALSQWTTGKLFRDEYEFRVPLHTPPGEYQLEIGWRQPSDDERWTPRIVRPLEPLSVSSVDSLLFSGITVR